ncbi:MAG TPA: retropepsin-like aspartic protease, partial [Pyrinomonadaceae bacterium]|nr:retropepsin-like aspartic protease [Pyrinomonadaceae bacterium]
SIACPPPFTMRNLKYLIAVVALVLLGIAPIAAQNSSIAVAPMQMRGLMPVVEVKLNGQGPFAFMIDTGAGMQADIDVSVATRLSLRANGRVINGDPSGINDREVSTTTIDSLTLGRGDGGANGVEFRNVTAVVRQHRITKDYPDVDGILGFALFTEYLLTLDYPAMQVRLSRGALPPANRTDILNFEIENRIPVIELGVGKMRVRAHVDSGNFVAGFILPEEIVEQLPLLTSPVIVGSARSVANRIELKQVQLRDAISIGRFSFPRATIQFPALSDTNVGFKVLREFTVTFDQKNRRMKLEQGSMSGAG